MSYIVHHFLLADSSSSVSTFLLGLQVKYSKVSLESCPREVFIHVTATRCWELVVDRVNKEITKLHKLGRNNCLSGWTGILGVGNSENFNKFIALNLLNGCCCCWVISMQGVLKGFDQATNIILDESHERVYSTKEGVQQLVLGLYIIRGDNISVIGELDEELDAGLDMSKLRAHPLKPVIH